MFANLFRFEVRFWLTGFMVYIFLAIILAFFLLLTSSDNVTVVGLDLEITNRNAPYVIQQYYGIASLLSILMVTAFVNSAASRDFAYRTNQIVFTKPVRKFPFLMGRFWGSVVVAALPMFGVSIAMLLVPHLPWVDSQRYGPVVWGGHIWGFLNFALPNVFFISSIIFAIAVWTRSTVASFVGALALLVGYSISQQAIGSLDNETLAMLVDPFGINTLTLQTKYWTISEKNTMALGMTGMMLVNRLIWLGTGLVILSIGYWRFDFSEGRARVRRQTTKQPVTVPVPATIEPRLSYGWNAQLAQLWSQWKVDFFGILKSNVFIVIMLAGTVQTIAGLLLTSSQGFGLSSLPVTYEMVDVIRGTMYVFMLAVIVFYAGVLVWKERESNLDEVYDALPHPTWIVFTAKLLALTGVVMAILLVGIVCGVSVQALNGFDRFQIGLYVSELLLIDGIQIFSLIVLAMLVHVVSPNKYLGYFAFIAIVIANQFVWSLAEIESRMFRYGSLPDYVYSDFFEFAPFAAVLSWFAAYWFLFTVLLTVIAILFWQRGRERGPRKRTRIAVSRWRGNLRRFSLVCGIAWLGIAVWVAYNTMFLNPLKTNRQQLSLQADYETQLAQYGESPTPRITDIKYTIDIFPAKRSVRLQGEQTIENKTDQVIPSIFISTAEGFETEVEIEGAAIEKDFPDLRAQIHRFDQPMKPGDTCTMTYTVRYEPKGFENSLSKNEFVQNGTFFNNAIVPQIGYQPSREMQDKNDRKRYDLGELTTLPELQPDNLKARGNTYLSNNSDWVNVETVISTSSDQVAIAPGSLIKTWQEADRRYFHYRVDHPSLNMFSFISARYLKATREWNGVDIEVYYHPEHEWNVPLMLRSIRRSLEYYSEHFGPYKHRQARIIEFPRVASFAQAFPGTMPYSEGIGFIADIKHEDDIDMVFYVVAHEMAHQWWAHQVIGANMRGATLLSETLAQYSALMVMEKEYGRDRMRKFLQYEMDSYLKARGQTTLSERPMKSVGTQQGYVHYRKGSVVMYYLKEMIGEDKVNAALKRMIDKFGYRGPPYPTSMDLIETLREVTPDDLKYLMDDLFEKVVLFANRAISANYRQLEDGRFEIELTIECKKMEADQEGAETQVDIADWIEIGAFASPEPGKRFGKTLYRERKRITKTETTHRFVVDTLPDQVGVDPFILLIDRNQGDNVRKPLPRE